MNRTKIEWTDYTWNPVTGCWGPGGTAEKPNRCSYCYAEKVANRFYRKQQDICDCCYPDMFAPTFHPERLSQPAKVKKPSKIFVCSMGDLFGDWVSPLWISKVISMAGRNPQHTFQFLTKNPKRLSNYPWPRNCWVGTTVTGQEDADERLPELLKVDASVLFVSHEPLFSGIDFRKTVCNDGDHLGPTLFNHGTGTGIGWGILGAQTGPGAIIPKVDWVMDLAQQYKDAGVPCFVKDSLYKYFPIREWPA